MKSALVIDDHPITHLGCGRLLRDLGYEAVHQAMSAPEAYDCLRKASVSLIVLDIGLPGVGGLTMIAPLRDRAPDAAILVFSMNDQSVFASRAIEAGARGFLSKNAAPEDFCEAVRTLELGRPFLTRELALELATTRKGGSSNPMSQLSDREHQVLRLIGQGKSLQIIADEIHVSYKTVANTSATLKKKLGVNGLPELIRFSIESGLS